MDMIIQLKQGVDYHQIRWGMSTDEMKDGYTYLIENAMVSIFDVNQMETQLY